MPRAAAKFIATRFRYTISSTYSSILKRFGNSRRPRKSNDPLPSPLWADGRGAGLASGGRGDDASLPDAAPLRHQRSPGQRAPGSGVSEEGPGGRGDRG